MQLIANLGGFALCLVGTFADEAKVKMYYFYVLRFIKNKKLYYGFTNDLRRRIKEHNAKHSTFTSRNGEFKLIFYEAYVNKKDAQAAETYFKSGHGREILKEKLKHYLKENES